MKKYIVMCAALAVAISFTSCKSSESAYKKAYEKALQQEAAQQQQQQVEQVDQIVIEEIPVIEETVAPVTTTEVTRSYNETTLVNNNENATVATPAPSTASSNVKVRQESVTLVNGSGLKAYSVVVGSFGVKANAERLQSTLKANGYDAQVASSGSMYRVIASTFDSKDASVNSRDALLSAYPDAWLLYKK